MQRTLMMLCLLAALAACSDAQTSGIYTSESRDRDLTMLGGGGGGGGM
ncbi:MAG TPA: hypothetical protein VLX85_15630 [Stellaceae bacterium]|nr:hypothetical protein [Stellaceae bacterium]